MLIALHKNARTTPAVRAEIAASNEPASVLAQRFGITEQTVYKWKKRSVFADRSHTAHRLQTVLTPAQETVVVHLRRTLLLPLDDLLAVTREFICPNVSRSGLDRCLRRHGAGNLNALKPREPAVAHKAFKSYEPGYVHMDVKYLPQMQDESQRRYLFVAIDRATRWVFVQFKANKTAASASAFLKALHKACPIRINKLLTDNGKEFTDRLFASREREPSGHHEFDQLCQELGIEHRLTKPRTPRTNGMVERFNGRIADVLKTHRFNSREDMEQTLLRYVALYNHQLPQSALKSSTPMQAMKEWYQTHPHLFHKRPYDRPGCDTYLKANPGKVNYASQGNGSLSHIGTEIFKQQSGTFMTHIPYRGSGPAVADVLAGQVQVFITTPPSVMQHVVSGKLKAFAVTGAKRHPGLPNVPTVAEAGMPDFKLEAWVGLFAPAATPPAVVAKLTADVKKALDMPETRQRADAAGIELRYLPPDALGELVKTETAYWAKTIKAAGIKAD